MKSFEKFHPVLTSHHTLDWLTQTPVKLVDDLYSKKTITTIKAEKMPNEILDTVKNINHIMQRVMNGQELTWGMTDSNSNQFVGIISLVGFEPPVDTGSIEFIVDQAHERYIPEVVERTIQFSKDHFTFQQLSVTVSQPTSQLTEQLQSIGFKKTTESALIIQLNETLD